jgi:hypothetical protein
VSHFDFSDITILWQNNLFSSAHLMETFWDGLDQVSGFQEFLILKNRNCHPLRLFASMGVFMRLLML